MACITVPDEDRTITDPQEISEFLQPFGIWYEKWDVEGRISEEATNDEILDAYQGEIDNLKQQGGYQTADVINVSPETPGLDAMVAKFAKEHTHSEDEVRFTVKGRGVFHINPENAPVFGITIESGDLINVPSGTRHWFNLCEDKSIRCIRLFLDPAGWAPHYVDDPTHEKYAAVCWGPSHIAAADDINRVVR